MSRIATMKRICVTPGTSAPIRRNGHRLPKCASPAATDRLASKADTRVPMPVTTTAPTSGSPPRSRPRRITTAKAPKSTPAITAKRTGAKN
jgi:hypothetical protein